MRREDCEKTRTAMIETRKWKLDVAMVEVFFGCLIEVMNMLSVSVNESVTLLEGGVSIIDIYIHTHIYNINMQCK